MSPLTTIDEREDEAASNPLVRASAGRRRVAVVHHWDADGIASAAMVLEELNTLSPTPLKLNRSPTIGRWRLSEEEIQGLCDWGADLVVLVDLAVGEADLGRLLDGVGVPVLMVDHHRAEVPRDPRVDYHNPVAGGGDEHESPSCTWVLHGLLGRPVDLLAILGVFGDRGRNVVHEPIWEELEGHLSREGLEPARMHRLVDLVDASAKRKDVAGVERAVTQLLDGYRDIDGLLGNPEWNDVAAEVERALAEQLVEGPERSTGGVLVKTIDTPYLVISTAARRLLRTHGHPVVLVANLGYSDVEAQVYVRCDGGIDLSPLIQDLRSRGRSAGGKGEVVGTIVPKAAIDAETDRILEFVASAMDAGSGTEAGV